MVERKVSDHIQNNFLFAVLSCEDKHERLLLESKIISTISLCQGCYPSRDWLGLYSPKLKIRKSGLWQVNKLYKEALSCSEIEDFTKSVENLRTVPHSF